MLKHTVKLVWRKGLVNLPQEYRFIFPLLCTWNSTVKNSTQWKGRLLSIKQTIVYTINFCNFLQSDIRTSLYSLIKQASIALHVATRSKLPCWGPQRDYKTKTRILGFLAFAPTIPMSTPIQLSSEGRSHITTTTKKSCFSSVFFSYLKYSRKEKKDTVEAWLTLWRKRSLMWNKPKMQGSKSYEKEQGTLLKMDTRG